MALRASARAAGALRLLLSCQEAVGASLQQAGRPPAAAAAAAAAAAWRHRPATSLSTAAASDPPSFRVSELIDAHSGPYGSEEQQASPLQVLEPGMRSYGGRLMFFGRVSTIKCLNSNKLVHEAVKEPGQGRVLVVDAGGSLAASVLGDILASVAKKHGWEGLVVNGCVRDSDFLPQIDIGVKALDTNPQKPGKGLQGQRDVPVVVRGAVIAPGDWLYADADGVLVSPTRLELPDEEQLRQLKASYMSSMYPKA